MQIQEAKEHQADLRTRNNKLITECEDNNKQTMSLQHEIVNWKKQVNAVKATNAETEANLKEIERQKDSFKQQLEETEKSVASLQEAEKNWQERYRQLECDKAKIMESESSLYKTEQQQVQVINDYKKRVTELEKESLNLKESKDQIQDSLVTCEDDTGELRHTITECTSTIAELQAKVESLQDDNTTMAQKHQLELDHIRKQKDDYKRKIKELEKQLDPEPSKRKVERVLSLLSQDSTDSLSVPNTDSPHSQELESLKEQHSKQLADVTANYEAVVDGLKQECHEMKQQLEKLALELSATPSRVEPKQFPLLTDEVRSHACFTYLYLYM